MSDRSEPRAPAGDFLRWAAVAFAIGFSVHGLDHLRRGLSASPARVIAIGTLQGALAVVAVWMCLTDRRTAPVWAMAVGFGSALLFTYGHLLPISLDSYVSEPHTHVMWFSWVTAVGEIGTGIVFGIAGVRARKSDDHPPRLSEEYSRV